MKYDEHTLEYFFYDFCKIVIKCLNVMLQPFGMSLPSILLLLLVEDILLTRHNLKSSFLLLQPLSAHNL